MHETSLNSYLHFEYVTGQPPRPLTLLFYQIKKVSNLFLQTN